MGRYIISTMNCVNPQRKKMKKWIISTILAVSSLQTIAGDHYLSGKLSNIASSSSNLLIMMDKGVPDNCAGVSYNWMRVKKEDTVMVSMVMSMWLSGKKDLTVYTSALTNGVCYIYSIDPVFNQ